MDPIGWARREMARKDAEIDLLRAELAGHKGCDAVQTMLVAALCERDEAEARLAAVIALCDEEASRVKAHNAKQVYGSRRNIFIAGVLAEEKVRAAATGDTK